MNNVNFIIYSYYQKNIVFNCWDWGR